MGFMDFMMHPTSDTDNNETTATYKFNENDLYNIEQVLKSLKINKDAFFKILRYAKVSNRRHEFKLLEMILALKPEKIKFVASEIRKLKTDKKKK